MIETVNRQRKIALDADALTEFARKAAAAVSETGNRAFTVAFVSDRKMKELNRFFRGKSATTDVLSFPLEAEDFELSAPESESLGDIVISAEQADRQAAEHNLTLNQEMKQLILHGLLHLCGFDHETDRGEMNSLELLYRDKLGIS